jgi:hypothetical protein
MIVYPTEWKRNYSDCIDSETGFAQIIENLLESVLYDIDVCNLAYSGGVDSTIMLSILRRIYDNVNTYTIASREDHPDILFARMGSEYYNTIHHEFIVEPDNKNTDKFNGDNVVRQFFESIKNDVEEIICCDGIDEFMCGYYDHMNMLPDTYEFYLNKLYPDHLVPLNKNSAGVDVYLPYLNESLINIYKQIPLFRKVSKTERKIIMKELAKKLVIPDEIINRNKYGFCDAFLTENKIRRI